MDKLMQAVNELKGDLGNSLWFDSSNRFLYRVLGKTYVAFINRDIDWKYTFICTVEEFNNLVAELSAAEWIK
jgi:hypothetical protein